ncbi:hypothetical protein [Aneurinibacillus migulanus]|jgi:septal ring factor EnvC (AmiA/AmiB activator)|uniref:Uncharacterized protein n=1 Tax=Aneurinibacillus migulanus TaxID=47500 RepID=A0A0K2W9R4_ANEMI|nr:hypothetical protein [Aneurinibacillus migulanus]MCP1357494.1 hypothetical protein [Aneurinibacillus migulanus]MED0890986.1 hypothetical protein [Aneurinibacillus migulanus]MED1614627.1 hypothetical protein [Aneurinibacillus migulanus]MED4731641.1 hypothetical protein [Aneurinibacillus migulanus]CEH27996.1 Uncharacterized protein BN1090_A2_00412 [Aneurinibacillus migulanus]
MPDVKTAQQIAESQYAFGILFVVLFLVSITAVAFIFKDLKRENKEREQELKDLIAEQKQESKEREAKLMAHLEKTNEGYERTSETLEKIQHGLATLESNVKDVWVEIKYLKRGTGQ